MHLFAPSVSRLDSSQFSLPLAELVVDPSVITGKSRATVNDLKYLL
jgi:hypothetical protein